MKTVEKLGKILLTIGRAFSSSSLIYHLLGMEVTILHFCGGMWRGAGRSEGGSGPCPVWLLSCRVSASAAVLQELCFMSQCRELPGEGDKWEKTRFGL